MYADHPAFQGLYPRHAAFFSRELTQRVDACALAGVYSAPRFTCDPPAYPRTLVQGRLAGPCSRNPR
ncbi:hypothetical protein E6B08_22195 [Pseudomonas putida]|uniref:Uncharacterized protein n=1 Tax=Pseudomonas putida TaxID=303 RepID=A0A4D6XA81_PSEPU|nr:hypothetical protein E6B08_22195 [Pseudomonas putida]